MTAPWPPGGLVYGIDVSRFQDSDGDGFGDLAGLERRIGYIAELGAEWVWLLPIYPSLRRDNGYDVDDHESVDERFGSLECFERVVEACHAHGLAVMVDLIIHHTSERHPWFQEARRDRESRRGHYYVWADEPVESPDDAPIFPGEDDRTWDYDEVAGAWYHHQFYRFQPDLNLAAHGVIEEMDRIAGLWLDRGVDGFRIDAALPAVRPKPTPGTDADDSTFYDLLRERLGVNHAGTVLVAEADEPPHDMRTLLDNRRIDGIIDFSLNNSFFLALAREDAGPLRDGLDRLDRASVQPGARLNFVRNADELDLEQLSASEQADVFAAFGPEPGMQIYGRGIRRGWAPMMGSVERYRLSLSLLLALPGVPLLLAGQELGVGDDLSAEGRGAVRTVMQWTGDDTGGFTDEASSPLILPAQRTGPYRFAVVNVAQQEEDPGSTLALTRELVRLRADAGLQRGAATVPELPGAPAVLALRSDGLLTLHNLSGAPQRVGGLPDADSATVLHAERWDGHTLGPYGFAWLRPAAPPSS